MEDRLPQSVISAACGAAMMSPCRKSKRGAVIFKRSHAAGQNTLFATSYNSPPWPYECDGSEGCRSGCREIAVHAEQRALLDSGIGDVPWRERPDLELVHVKVVKPAGCETKCDHDPISHLVPSGPPSCAQCSKLILEARIGCVWLFEPVGVYAASEPVPVDWDRTGVWSRYDSASFHRISLRNNNLHIHI